MNSRTKLVMLDKIVHDSDSWLKESSIPNQALFRA